MGEANKCTASSWGGSSLAEYDVSDYVLGMGSYGQVLRCTHKPSGKEYAMKKLEKQKLVRYNRCPEVHLEKNILRSCDSDYVVKLSNTFADDVHLYFILEYCPGGELLAQIRASEHGFSLERTRFYAAEIIAALGDLRSMGVVHRDLKPENMMLDGDMHLKLIDFGSACLTEDSPLEGKFSKFAGTPNYLPPEALDKNIFSYGTDLWALGCCIYQMLTKKLTFNADGEYQTFQAILARDFTFPADFPSAARELVDQLLDKEPSQRVGFRSIEDLENHPFFGGNFNEILDSVPPTA